MAAPPPQATFFSHPAMNGARFRAGTMRCRAFLPAASRDPVPGSKARGKSADLHPGTRPEYRQRRPIINKRSVVSRTTC